MSYLTPSMIKVALMRLVLFENDLQKVFLSYGYDFRENLGRRNALLSQAQEHEIAKVLRTKFTNVEQNGRPGHPDVMIHDIKKELECKLTSGHGKSKTCDLQTDWMTLRKKGSLDYLYVIANDTFNRFCVLFFESLTCDDFHPPANGSRGKSRMNKKLAMKKVTVLHGKISVINDRMIKKYSDRIRLVEVKRDDEITQKLTLLIDRNETAKRAEHLIKNIELRYEKKISRLRGKIENWRQTDPKYTLHLEACV